MMEAEMTWNELSQLAIVCKGFILIGLVSYVILVWGRLLADKIRRLI